MSADLTGRVAIVTGGGRGLGRQYALGLARHGALVVVNDLGGERDGTGSSGSAATEVVREIEHTGGRAVADTSDVADWDGARTVVQRALDAFGRLDALICNAGILRDRALVNMTADEWDAVIRVHLRGTFAPAHFAAAYWREAAKAGGPVDARIITTSSPAGLYGNVGQVNYAAAKAGIAAFTITAAMELARYGVTVNAIAPVASTRLTSDILDDQRKAVLTTAHVAPLVLWLTSTAGAAVTGRVFTVRGGAVGVAEGWHLGPVHELDGVWSLADVDRELPILLRAARPLADISGRYQEKGG